MTEGLFSVEFCFYNPSVSLTRATSLYTRKALVSSHRQKNTTKEKSLVVFVFSPLRMQRRCFVLVLFVLPSFQCDHKNPRRLFIFFIYLVNRFYFHRNHRRRLNINKGIHLSHHSMFRQSYGIFQFRFQFFKQILREMPRK